VKEFLPHRPPIEVLAEEAQSSGGHHADGVLAAPNTSAPGLPEAGFPAPLPPVAQASAPADHSARPPAQRAVVLVDGIVSSGYHRLLPDVDWADYVTWLARRRPDLAIAHLAQPLDWRDIISGRADEYGDIVRKMLRELLAARPTEWREVVVLGYSLGGLTALNVAHDFMQRVQGEVKLEYLSFVTFGAPFGGTHTFNQLVAKLIPQNSHLERIYSRLETLQYLRELVQGSSPTRLRVLLHHITNDEMVSRESAWLPAEWLEFASPQTDTQWATYELNLGRFRLMPHISFPHHPVALAYVDGLIDGLLPPEGVPDRGFELFRILPRGESAPEIAMHDDGAKPGLAVTVQDSTQ
jgi:pimeloyl-ACP methyl ester carboxylesterase